MHKFLLLRYIYIYILSLCLVIRSNMISRWRELFLISFVFMYLWSKACSNVTYFLLICWSPHLMISSSADLLNCWSPHLLIYSTPTTYDLIWTFMNRHELPWTIMTLWRDPYFLHSLKYIEQFGKISFSIFLYFYHCHLWSYIIDKSYWLQWSYGNP